MRGSRWEDPSSIPWPFTFFEIFAHQSMYFLTRNASMNSSNKYCQELFGVVLDSYSSVGGIPLCWCCLHAMHVKPFHHRRLIQFLDLQSLTSRTFQFTFFMHTKPSSHKRMLRYKRSRIVQKRPSALFATLCHQICSNPWKLTPRTLTLLQASSQILSPQPHTALKPSYWATKMPVSSKNRVRSRRAESCKGNKCTEIIAQTKELQRLSKAMAGERKDFSDGAAKAAFVEERKESFPRHAAGGGSLPCVEGKCSECGM